MFYKKLVLLDSVKIDIQESKNFYESIEAGAGQYFLNCILSDLQILSSNSGIHKKVHGFYQALSKKFPFAIYYDVIDEKIVVVAILDMRQNPNSIIKRLRSL